jgi:hypothetical protein
VNAPPTDAQICFTLCRQNRQDAPRGPKPGTKPCPAEIPLPTSKVAFALGGRKAPLLTAALACSKVGWLVAAR